MNEPELMKKVQVWQLVNYVYKHEVSSTLNGLVWLAQFPKLATYALDQEAIHTTHPKQNEQTGVKEKQNLWH